MARDYFRDLQTLAGHAVRASGRLRAALEGPGPADPAGLRALYRAAERDRRDMLEALAREFLPPVERGDLFDLARALAGLTGRCAAACPCSPGAARAARGAAGLAGAVERGCKALAEGMAALGGFRRNRDPALAALLEARRLAGEAEKRHGEALRALLERERDPAARLAGCLLLERLLACAAACARAADAAERLMLVNG